LVSKPSSTASSGRPEAPRRSELKDRPRKRAALSSPPANQIAQPERYDVSPDRICYFTEQADKGYSSN
jgi:hypothetical protein